MNYIIGELCSWTTSFWQLLELPLLVQLLELPILRTANFSNSQNCHSVSLISATPRSANFGTTRLKPGSLLNTKWKLAKFGPANFGISMPGCPEKFKFGHLNFAKAGYLLDTWQKLASLAVFQPCQFWWMLRKVHELFLTGLIMD